MYFAMLVTHVIKVKINGELSNKILAGNTQAGVNNPTLFSVVTADVKGVNRCRLWRSVLDVICLTFKEKMETVTTVQIQQSMTT